MKMKRQRRYTIRKRDKVPDHRRNLEYSVGGNIDPLFTEPRPNKYGWYLLITGVIFLFAALLGSADAVIPSYYFAVLIALALLIVAAGLRLLIKHHSGGSRMKKGQQK